jgi:zinc protease
VPGTYRVDVGGIPCFIEDRDGPFYFGLTFRVGFVDERLARRGITHLVEHLALFGLSAERLMVNGSVGLTQTDLYIRGEPREIAHFAHAICAALRQLPLERLEAESRVLRTEGRSRGGNAYTSMLANRFGADGYGLAGYPEFGLIGTKTNELQSWAYQWFNASNVAMWATRPLPNDLDVSLPAGERFPPPAPQPLPWPLPGMFNDDGNIVGVSFLVARNDASMLAVRLLERRMHDRLRVADGHSYTVQALGESWTADHTHGAFIADTLADHAAAVRDGMLGELARLTTEAPPAAELDAIVAEFERGWSDRDAAAGLASSSATNELIGRPQRGTDEAIAALREIAPDAVSMAADDMFQSAIALLPTGIGMRDQRFIPIPPGSPSAVHGTEYHRLVRLDDDAALHALILGAAGISYVGSHGLQVTVPGGDVVAVQRWTDGARSIWGRDGLRIFVHPGEWVNGQAAVAFIDSVTGPHVVIEMGQEAGSRYLDEVAQRAEHAPARKGPFERVLRR